MRTMREQRIVWVLSELSMRISECNTIFDDLQDDFNHSRRVSMQIRKAAQKCVNDSYVAINRFLNIAKANNLDEDSAMFATFKRRMSMNDELMKFFL